MIFAKCLSASHRDQVIACVRAAQTIEHKKPWADIDRPIDVRTAKNVLFAFKRMLLEWGYDKREVYVDVDSNTLSVAGIQVLKTEVNDATVKIVWCDGKWEKWEELQTAEELK